MLWMIMILEVSRIQPEDCKDGIDPLSCIDDGTVVMITEVDDMQTTYGKCSYFGRVV